MRLVHKALLASLPVGFLVGLACRETTAPSVAPGMGASIQGDLNGLTVLTSQLRAYPPNPVAPPSQAFGWASLSFFPPSPIFPPNPVAPPACISAPAPTIAGTTPVSICGRIQNPGAETFVSGGLFTGIFIPGADVPLLTLSGFSNATTGCPAFIIQGTFQVADAFVMALKSAPSNYGLYFTSLEHPAGIIGSFAPGGVAGGPATPTGGASSFPPNPLIPSTCIETLSSP